MRTLKHMGQELKRMLSVCISKSVTDEHSDNMHQFLTRMLSMAISFQKFILYTLSIRVRN